MLGRAVGFHLVEIEIGAADGRGNDGHTAQVLPDLVRLRFRRPVPPPHCPDAVFRPLLRWVRRQERLIPRDDGAVGAEVLDHGVKQLALHCRWGQLPGNTCFVHLIAKLRGLVATKMHDGRLEQTQRLVKHLTKEARRRGIWDDHAVRAAHAVHRRAVTVLEHCAFFGLVVAAALVQLNDAEIDAVFPSGGDERSTMRWGVDLRDHIDAMGPRERDELHNLFLGVVDGVWVRHRVGVARRRLGVVLARAAATAAEVKPREALALDTPTLVVCEVPVQDVELEVEHVAEDLTHVRHADEVPCGVDHEPAPSIVRRVLDLDASGDVDKRKVE
eukprot:PhM_4_TR14212/c0_g1_i1/m.101606